ncbi:hypothetical protein A3L04_08535 [Thermococcus chitonophagus]|uniref:Uncharacterized protein n=1 Tax=Thermococcus chitonophagus TaxID=54262 RepID=A0A160VRX3_9EURY|nr:hypothetical protein [Thermococcus chitonophagus]ASJ17112.1 hypothetical protein A3L04_08535 [Thermococcus chitonophagus]CUX77717.1 hypothetical protein CHITON_0938 [Thermococcus chitonophagus]
MELSHVPKIKIIQANLSNNGKITIHTTFFEGDVPERLQQILENPDKFLLVGDRDFYLRKMLVLKKGNGFYGYDTPMMFYRLPTSFLSDFNELDMCFDIEVVTPHIPEMGTFRVYAFPVALLFKFGSYCRLCIRKKIYEIYYDVPDKYLESHPSMFHQNFDEKIKYLFGLCFSKHLNSVEIFRIELRKKFLDFLEELDGELHKKDFDLALIDVQSIYECFKTLFLDWVKQ